MDVFGEVKQLRIVKDFDAFKSALKEPAGMMVLLLKIHGISDADFFDKVRYGRGFFFLKEKKMEVIRH